MPVADVVRANFSYASCLLEIAKARGGVQEVSGKDAAAEERAVSLGILACGASFSERVWGSFSVSDPHGYAGILRNLAPFPPPSSIASVDLDKEIILPMLVPVVTSVSLQEATETVRELILAQQACHELSSIPPDLTATENSPMSPFPISRIRSITQNQTTNPKPNLASSASRRG